ncbi:embryonal Fyn-associated substrate isoform X12 [Macaca fascicularis]|uniref:embryonal Fyn-associated substrate isoform X12 n=1 Tax=Macaca fascicularis TaxID=9541 RepID=UPI003D15EA24
MAIATSAQLARALYDNTAESPQELSFRRGDVLRVLQREGAGGLDGWCLCSLHGQQGIVPANRVKLLPAGPAPKPGLSPAPPAQLGSPYPAPDHSNEDQEVYDVPPTALRVLSSSPYDCPASFSHPLTRVALQPPEEDDAPYDVPLTPKPPAELEPDLEWEGGREPGPPIYAAPSNLKRASALLNLYEAPEELLADGEGRKGSIQDRPLPPPPPRLPGYGGPKVEGDPEGREMEDDPAGHHNEYEGIPMAEEYDYVHLKGMDKAQGSRPPDQACTRDPELLERGMPALQEALSPGEPLVLSTGDLQLLHFYAGQCQSHYSALQVAVAALMSSTQANQPPRLFVPHSKRVVVAAHRLVFVGDTLGRLAASAPLRAQPRVEVTALPPTSGRLAMKSRVAET